MIQPAPQNLLDLIRRPHAFFEALRALPPVPWRYAWLPALAGLAGGLSGALLSRSILDSQALARSAVPVGFLWGVTIFSSVFLSLLSWLVLWGMGQLGAGKEGRSGEVYGASFLAPLLWSVVLAVLALILPPQVNVAAPNFSGLSGPELVTAIQKYSTAVSAQYALSPVVRFSGVMNYAIYIVQFWLAYIGFRVMTQESRVAWKGVLYPGVLLLVLGAALLLVAGAVAGLAGGLGGLT